MKSSKIYSVFKEKCPVCHVGDVFESKQLYHPKKFDKMHERCPHCDHKFEIEHGFWYGAMYVSYGLTVAFSCTTFVLTYLIYPAAGAWLYFGLIVLVIFGAVPLTYRMSRMIWMNMFSHYDPQRKKI